MGTVAYTDDLSVQPAAIGYVVIRSTGAILSHSDTLEEAEQAKRAFELVLAPRFTRDEAIAIVKAHLDRLGVAPGLRAALEALAAAGVFVDADEGGNTAHHMADKLDAAGIR